MTKVNARRPTVRDDERVSGGVVPGLAVGVAEHREVSEEQHDERHPADDPAQKGARVTDRLAGDVVDDFDVQGVFTDRLAPPPLKHGEVDGCQWPCDRSSAAPCRNRLMISDDRQDDSIDNQSRQTDP